MGARRRAAPSRARHAGRSLIRTALLAGGAAALLSAAPAQAAVCRYEPPPPRVSEAERALEDAISARRSLTLPRGRRFVQRVNADPAAQRRGWSRLNFPVTRREARYLDQRAELQDDRVTRRLDAYVRRHAAVFGPSSTEDDYPRRPYVQLRVTRDLARHRAAVDHRFDHRFRIERVRHSERELLRIQDRIDARALHAEGIEFVTSGVDVEHVELEVTTARDDAAAVVRRLYGPAVRVVVIARTPTYLDCGVPSDYRVDPDGRTLHFTYVGSGSVEPRYVELVETAGEVHVGMVIESPYGPVTADAYHHALSVTLSAPLGDRVVRAIRSGRPVRLSDDRAAGTPPRR